MFQEDQVLDRLDEILAVLTTPNLWALFGFMIMGAVLVGVARSIIEQKYELDQVGFWVPSFYAIVWTYILFLIIAVGSPTELRDGEIIVYLFVGWVGLPYILEYLEKLAKDKFGGSSPTKTKEKEND